MRKNLFSQTFQKITFFEKLQQVLTESIKSVQNSEESLSLALEKCSIEYLVALEHVPICRELLYGEYVLSFDNTFNLPTLDKDFSEMYVGFKEHNYHKLNQIIHAVSKKNYHVSQKEYQITSLLERISSVVKQQLNDNFLLNCLDDLQILIDYDQLITKSKVLEDQYDKKIKSIAYYQSCIGILALIKSYNEKAQLNEITTEGQQELLNNLDEIFTNSPEMLAVLLEPLISRINHNLVNIGKKYQQSLQNLLSNANHIMFANSFGIKEDPKIIKPTNLILLPLEQLLVLKEYLEGLNSRYKHDKILKSIDISIQYCKYKELCINLIEIKKIFNLKDILYALAEFKSNALKSIEKHVLWEPIISKLEQEFFVDIKAKNTIHDKQVEIFMDDPVSFDLFFKFKINVLSWCNFYQLASERFLAGASFTKNINRLKSRDHLSQQELEKMILLSSGKGLILEKNKNINSEEQQELYSKFINILSNLDKFKKTIFRDFESIDVDNYLISFDVENARDFLNKKLAYETLYSRHAESNHSKIYQELYSKWIELQALYGEGFIVCDLDKNVATIDDLFIQIRDNFLSQKMLDLCDKTSFELSQLYTACCDRDLFEHLTKKVNNDVDKLNKLKDLLKKDKFSADDIKLIKDFEAIVENSSVQRYGSSSKYIDELSQNCQKQNPLFGSGEKLEKVSKYFDSLQKAPDKKAAISKITKITSGL